eukprot:Nitzschia sp. Nitz4//scaffold1_size375055//287973//288605//NITZ4_000312-RA/size375055-exonerate_protein2genome-gene-0.111-mRNA-1//-1//CDS//3329541153//9421//frame0
MSTVDLLPANLQKTLHEVVERCNLANGGICAILLSTTEGVPLGRVYADQRPELNEDVLNALESTWAPASKQFPLLEMGKEAKVVTAIYDHGTIFHVYQAPVVVTILVSPQSNLGAVRSTGIPLLKEVLEPLCTTLLNSLAPVRDDWPENDASYPQQGYYH